MRKPSSPHPLGELGQQTQQLSTHSCFSSMASIVSVESQLQGLGPCPGQNLNLGTGFLCCLPQACEAFEATSGSPHWSCHLDIVFDWDLHGLCCHLLFTVTHILVPNSRLRQGVASDCPHHLS